MKDTGHRIGRIVGSGDCDALGHMNVGYYFLFCGEAAMSMQNAIGWTPGAANDGRRYSFVLVKSESAFYGELLAGDKVTIECACTGFGTKSGQFRNSIYSEDGRLIFRTWWKSALMDLDSRRAVELPEDLKEALKQVFVQEDITV